jgi:ABC-2 type transport system ATP-binding protein
MHQNVIREKEKKRRKIVELIRINNIYKSFSNHQALEDVSFSISKGVILGLLGPNGAGKTTLIRILNQIIFPDSGEILFNNKPLHRKHIEDIGYLPEERGLYKKMKVGEQAIYLARLKGLSEHEAIQRLKYWFKKFEIESWWNRKVEELSKGMQQKVQFIVTVIHQPGLLIFDEPFSGFDPINTEILKQEILTLKENGATIILSTHNMASVEEICDEIILLNRSKKILEGKLVDIKQHFKKHLFSIEFAGTSSDFLNSLPENYKILSQQENYNSISLTVQITPPSQPNDLLNFFIPNTQILSFQEVLPSMNEIFIETVTS